MTVSRYDDIIYGMTSCDDCGAYSLDASPVTHHATCTPGAAAYWEKYYNDAYEEDMALLQRGETE